MNKRTFTSNVRSAACVLALGLVAAPVSAFEIINDVELDFFGAFGAGYTSISGIESLAGDGFSYIVQEAPGGIPANGDRFYDVGFIQYTTANDVDTFTNTALSTLLPAGETISLFFELGGSLVLPGVGIGNPAVPDYVIDRGTISLILDNDTTPNDTLGSTLSDFSAAFTASLAAGTYVMPGAGPGGSVDPVGLATSDGTPGTELINLEFIVGSAGGDVPNGFNVPASTLSGSFGVDMTWNTCVAGIFFDSAGDDLCDGANPDPTIASSFLAVIGTSGASGSVPTIYGAGAGNICSGGGACTMITNTTTLGDTASFGIPEPTSLALLAIGLLGLGRTVGRKRS